MTFGERFKQLPRQAASAVGRLAARRALLPMVFAEATPLDLRYVGRTLLHAAAVGIACGLAGAAFFGLIELVQRFLLQDVAG
jgi:CIC family chloride channel protein